LLGRFAVPRRARELINGLAVVLETEPFHTVEDGRDRLWRGAGAVRVLDPQQEGAAHLLGEQPGEKGRARASDMEVAWGGRGEACDDAHRGEFGRVVKARAW